MSSTPIYTALQEYKNLKRASFHTPGHKNNVLNVNEAAELDYTELPGTDDLYDPHGCIEKSEYLTTLLYGSKRTLYSAGGCSLCIFTMLKLALPYGGKVIASRMIHRSAINAMALLNAQVVWVLPEQNQNNFVQISASDIELQIKDNPDTDCVYITSPDYYGHIADIESIAKICHSHGIPLLVDNAHGAHLKFLKNDIHPITLGADMCADSAHKTLPVMTGGAYLHIANEAYILDAKNAMSIFGSTSPSYPILASLDLCQDWLKVRRKEFLKFEAKIKRIKKIATEKGILDNCGLCDPFRVTLNTAKIGLFGYKAAERFRKFGVEPEFANSTSVVFIATPMNKNRDLARLKAAIEELPVKKAKSVKHTQLTYPKIKRSLHDALFSKKKTVQLEDAKGQICGSMITKCPPGIPIAIPGEEIDENLIKSAADYGIFSIDVLE